MPYLVYQTDSAGVMKAHYIQVYVTITPNSEKVILSSTFTYGKQVWRYDADFATVDDAKLAAESLVINNYNLNPVAPPAPDARQQAIQRYSKAMIKWVSFGSGRTQVPAPVLNDFLNDPNYVWPYMNANPVNPVRPGGGGGNGPSPRPV